jgi:hypothetical protein
MLTVWASALLRDYQLNVNRKLAHYPRESQKRQNNPQMMFPLLHPGSLPAREGRGGREILEGRAVQHSGVDFARDELAIP